MNPHDRAMMNLSARAQFDVLTGGNAIQVCRRHPILVKACVNGQCAGSLGGAQ